MNYDDSDVSMQQLRYFARVAELENFTRAAEVCHVSQPSLSQQIGNLEKKLGQPLFERLGRGVRLTEAGRFFKQRVDQILSLLEDARSGVIDSPDRGRLVVAAIPTIAPYYLPSVLHEFARECPLARVEVVEDVTTVTVRKVMEGVVDVAVLALPVQGDSLEVEALFTEELLAVFPAGHPLTAKSRVSLRDLADEVFVLLHEAHCLTGTTLGFCQRRAFSPTVTSQVHQLATIQELVRLGGGVSLVPEMAARLDTSPGRVYRPLSGDRPTRTIAIVWNRLRFQSQLFRRFLCFLRKQKPTLSV
jgi:LysR family transcriptional regulator, hydrogen peroxide-inducible genes activator